MTRYIELMKLPEMTATNEALLENVFVRSSDVRGNTWVLRAKHVASEPFERELFLSECYSKHKSQIFRACSICLLEVMMNGMDVSGHGFLFTQTGGINDSYRSVLSTNTTLSQPASQGF